MFSNMHSLNAIKWLRYTGIGEGVSSILLFFVAMPLKYMADRPEAVRVFGMMHGILFILYVLALVRAVIILKRSWGWSAKILIAAIFPFGPFIIEPGLRREQEALGKVSSE
jgi:integral membrane protein